MKNSLVRLLVLAFALCHASAVAIAQDLDITVAQQLKQMTVRVLTTDAGQPERRVGSGFIWPDSGHVVTALHVVAGGENIQLEYAEGSKYEVRSATVERVLKAADLALLKVENPIDRVPASIGNATGRDRWVVGFPLGLADKWGRRLRMSEIAPSILQGMLEEDPRNALKLLGFPDQDISITSLEGDLVPGDSGAPIVDASGRVAAVGNGGLRGGTIGLGWAVPEDWLTKLLSSNEANPTLTPAQWAVLRNQFLYGSRGRLSDSGKGGIKHFASSFEVLGNAQNGELVPGFVASEPVFGTCLPLSSYFTAWKISPKPHTGRHAINLIPEGNPATERTSTTTCNSPTLSVSAGILDKNFNTDGASNLRLAYYRLSTSNPRPAKVHNCDSSMDIYVKRDERDWEHYSSMCGEYKSEGGMWDLMDLKIPTFGASEMQLGFLYQVQNVQEPDPSAVYLLDDLDVLVMD